MRSGLLAWFSLLDYTPGKALDFLAFPLTADLLRLDTKIENHPKTLISIPHEKLDFEANFQTLCVDCETEKTEGTGGENGTGFKSLSFYLISF